MAGLVSLVLLPSVTSETVSVWLPALLKVTLKEAAPLRSAVSAGKLALASLEVRSHGVGDAGGQVPEGVHGVDRDIEGRAGVARAGRAGLAAG
jgi:hypothetical protein